MDITHVFICKCGGHGSYTVGHIVFRGHLKVGDTVHFYGAIESGMIRNICIDTKSMSLSSILMKLCPFLYICRYSHWLFWGPYVIF